MAKLTRWERQAKSGEIRRESWGECPDGPNWTMVARHHELGPSMNHGMLVFDGDGGLESRMEEGPHPDRLEFDTLIAEMRGE